MAHRKFVDRDGNGWEIRPRTRSVWELSPVGDNPQRSRDVASPGYEKDPYELSREELQALLDGAGPASTRQVKSPFSE
jgi:hypothetical protein